MSDFLARLGRRAAGTETRWHTRPRARFEPPPPPGVGRASALPLLDDVLDPPRAGTPTADAEAAPATGRPTAVRAPGEHTHDSPDDDAWREPNRAADRPVPDRSGEPTATRRSRREATGPVPAQEGEAAPTRTPAAAPGSSGRRGPGARTAPAARDAVGRAGERLLELPDRRDLGTPPGVGDPDDAARVTAPARDAAPSAPPTASDDVTLPPSPLVRAAADDPPPPAVRRRARRPPGSAPPPNTEAGRPADPDPTAQPRSGRPHGAEPDLRALVAAHVVPALRDQGILGATERVELRLDGDTGPARDTVGGRRTGIVLPGATVDPPPMHLHIGSVQVVRPAPAPSAPAAPPADPSSDRLATFLAGRRSTP